MYTPQAEKRSYYLIYARCSNYTSHVSIVNRLYFVLFRLTFCLLHVTIKYNIYRAFFVHSNTHCATQCVYKSGVLRI